MNIFSMIQERKNKFRQVQSQRRDSNLLKSIADRRAQEEISAKNTAIAENRKVSRDLRMAPIKKFSAGVRERLERNAQAQKNNRQSNMFSSGDNNLFTKSDSGARNIYGLGSGNNPFDFSDKKNRIKR